PVQVLLTKCDKLKAGARKAQLVRIREAALAFCGDVEVDLYSSLQGTGVDKLKNKLNSWYQLVNVNEDEEKEEEIA
ncbi:MAG: ribosome biogenesis GTP-binding protein YihA/YsxC, partial [Enterovibrio sp.]